jgi:hypothetical protein
MSYRIERNPYLVSLAENWCFQIVGPEGVIARFGKPIPASNVAVVWNNAEIAANIALGQLADQTPSERCR